MGSPLGDTRRHRQHRLFPIQRLNLGFFVHAQHDGPVRRGHVKADDILHLVDEQRIGGKLEGLTAMWLQAEGGPDPADRGVRQARHRGHRADRPMGGVLRRGVQRPFDDLGHLVVRYCAGPAGTIFVGQSLDPVPDEPSAPLADGMLMHSGPRADLLALQPFRAEQNHPAPGRQRPRGLVTPDLRLEKVAFIGTQNHLVRYSTNHIIPPKSEGSMI